jgi:opine dehydrogenase
MAKIAYRPRVTVLGAGHGGQAVAGHLALEGLHVTLYNRSEPRLAPLHAQGGIQVEGVVTGFGDVQHFTTNLAQALADAELIMIVVPASAHRELAWACAPHLRDGQVIVLNPGRTGGALEFAHVLRQAHVTARIYVAETQTLVYSCRLAAPGQVRVLSLKRHVGLAALPATDTDHILAVVGPLYPQFVPAADVLETGLGNIGAVFHPSLMVLQAARLEAGPPFHFYGDVTPSVARFLDVVDRERLAVARAFGVRGESASDWLVHSYEEVSGQDLYARLRSVAAYRAALAPPTLDHRYLTEDVPTGLVPLVELAGVAGVPTPVSRALVNVASALLGRDFRAEGRTAGSLGLAGMDVEQIKEFVKNGSRE